MEGWWRVQEWGMHGWGGAGGGLVYDGAVGTGWGIGGAWMEACGNWCVCGAAIGMGGARQSCR